MKFEIDYFEIKKLYGELDLKIPFKDNIKVLIAENGYGKTTIINIIYHALKNDPKGLEKYPFESCSIHFKNKQTIIFNRKEEKNIDYKDELSRNLISDLSNISNESVDILSLRKHFKKFEKIRNLFAHNYGIKHFYEFLSDYFKNIIFFNIENESVSRRSQKEIVRRRNIMNNKNYFHKYLSENNILNLNKDGYNPLDISEISYFDLLYFYNDYKYHSLDESRSGDNPTEIRDLYNVIHIVLEMVITNILKDGETNRNFLEKNNKKILFLPTYRRIEHDSEDLFSGDFILKEGSSLSFGMGDVQNLFVRISNKMNAYFKENFNKIKSNAMNDILSGRDFDVDLINISIIFDKYTTDEFEKILMLVGSDIDSKNKYRLVRLFEDKKTKKNINHNELYQLGLIKKIIDIYAKLQAIILEIRNYISVCNKYLSNKELVFNEDTLEIGIYRDRNDSNSKRIYLTDLSSGEKQIISLFSKLYLSHIPSLDIDRYDNTNIDGYWILFDEPELSLSVQWQKQLLPDILASNKCEFLIATTHSPFIFNNNLKYYTSHFREGIINNGK